MPSQSWGALVNQNAQMSVAGTTLSASTTLTDVSPVPQYSTLAGDVVPGKTYLLLAHGVLTTAASAQGTLLLGFYYGGVAGTALVTTTALTPAASAVNWSWKLEATVTCRTVGTSGTMWSQGEFHTPTSLTAWSSLPIPQIAPAAVTVDTTVAKTITVGAQFSSATTNTLTCHQLLAVALN